MPTRYEEVMRILGLAAGMEEELDALKYIEQLHASHEALLRAAKDASALINSVYDMMGVGIANTGELDEAIRNAEALS